MEQTKKNYESPQLEIVDVKVEKGFASSPDGSGEGGLWQGGF